MAVDGHQRSVPIRMRPWAVRAATDRDREANRRKAGVGTARRAVRPRDLLALRLPAARPRVPGRARVRLRHRPGVPAAGHGRLRLRRPGLLRPVLRGPEGPVRRPRVPRPAQRPRNTAASEDAPGDPATGSPAPRRSRVPGPGDPRVLPARLPGSRLPSRRASRQPLRRERPGDLAGDRRAGGPPRHRPAAGRGGPGRLAPRRQRRVPGAVVRQPAPGRPGARRPRRRRARHGRPTRGSRA